MPRPTSPDYYLLLGVGRGASNDEIRSAYRRLIRTAHPDAGGSDDRFRLVHTAYEILIDPATRADYDRERSTIGAKAGSVATTTATPTRSTTTSPSGRRARTNVAGTTATSRPRAATTADVESEPTLRPSPSGLLLGVSMVVGVLVIVGVIVAVSITSSGPTTANQRAGGSAPATVTFLPNLTREGDPAVSFDRWRQLNRVKLEAISTNGDAIGRMLSTRNGAINIDGLRVVCRVRSDLLDELEAAGPPSREDVAAAITRFLAAERRAVSACLSSPPDFDWMGDWAERARPDLDLAIKAVREG